MAGDDIYNDRSGITSLSRKVKRYQGRRFLKEVSKYPTHPKKRWIVSSGSFNYNTWKY